MCPLEYGFKNIIQDTNAMSIIIYKIKELFTYLTSYNVAFLNPDEDPTMCVDTTKIVLHTLDIRNEEHIGSEIYADDLFDTLAHQITIIETSKLHNDIDNEISIGSFVDKESSIMDLTVEDEAEISDLVNHYYIGIEYDGVEIEIGE